jgi:hypothetical protein
MFQTKVMEKIKKKLYSVTFPENHTFMRYCGKNLVEPDRPHENMMGRMRLVCCINKATDTQSEYAIRMAVVQQQWLRERTPMLRLYAHFLSC